MMEMECATSWKYKVVVPVLLQLLLEMVKEVVALVQAVTICTPAQKQPRI